MIGYKDYYLLYFASNHLPLHYEIKQVRSESKARGNMNSKIDMQMKLIELKHRRQQLRHSMLFAQRIIDNEPENHYAIPELERFIADCQMIIEEIERLIAQINHFN